jgi:2-C-methyl-D-erythritol 4-phosphate cytidylyltransferase
MIAAVLVAAGRGVRMGGGKPKQYLPLAGKPVLVQTLNRFLSCNAIDAVNLVVAQNEIDTVRSLLFPLHSVNKKIDLVVGGDSRRSSVFNGLQAIEAREGIVLIHDGVRPLISQRLIKACIRGARQWGACIPALAVNDTLKQVDDDNLVQSTVPRRGLQLVQTPQAFELSLIRKAHQQAMAENWQVTDDASLVERLGGRVKVIPGMPENIKITTPDDLRLAEILLKTK